MAVNMSNAEQRELIRGLEEAGEHSKKVKAYNKDKVVINNEETEKTKATTTVDPFGVIEYASFILGNSYMTEKSVDYTHVLPKNMTFQEYEKWSSLQGVYCGRSSTYHSNYLSDKYNGAKSTSCVMMTDAEKHTELVKKYRAKNHVSPNVESVETLKKRNFYGKSEHHLSAVSTEIPAALKNHNKVTTMADIKALPPQVQEYLAKACGLIDDKVV